MHHDSRSSSMTDLTKRALSFSCFIVYYRHIVGVKSSLISTFNTSRPEILRH